MNAFDECKFTPLLVVCCAKLESGQVGDVVRELLLAQDTDANIQGPKIICCRNPLQLALENENKWSVIQQLLAWNPTEGPFARQRIDVNARDSTGWTTLHCAAAGGQREVMEELLKWYPDMVKDNIHSKSNKGNIPLHVAAIFGNHEAVGMLLELNEDSVNIPNTFNRDTPLHLAVLAGSPKTVEVIFKRGKDVNVSQPNWKGATPLDYARTWYVTRKTIFYGPKSGSTTSITRDTAREIIEMLEGFDIQGLQTDRQVYVNSANAVLVGAALIASITFASWLQPPLGLATYYQSEFLVASPALPGTYESFAAIEQHWTIELFWVFNSLSFFFAIATIIAGADAALPKRGVLLKEALRQVQHAVLRSSCLLVVSVVCVIGAFASAGFTVLPPIYKYKRQMVGTVSVGGLACTIVLRLFLIKLFTWTSIMELCEVF